METKAQTTDYGFGTIQLTLCRVTKFIHFKRSKSELGLIVWILIISILTFYVLNLFILTFSAVYATKTCNIPILYQKLYSLINGSSLVLIYWPCRKNAFRHVEKFCVMIQEIKKLTLDSFAIKLILLIYESTKQQVRHLLKTYHV